MKKLVKISVKQYILFTFIILVMMPTTIILLIIISKYFMYVIDNTMTQKQDTLHAISYNIDNQLDNLKDISMSIYFNDATISHINHYPDNASDEVVIQDFANSLINSHKYLSSVYITLGDQTIYAGHKYQNIKDFFNNNESEVLEKKGKVYWVPTQKFLTDFSRNVNNFVLCRSINSPDGNIGFLWVFINESFFADNINYDERAMDSDIYILDENDMIFSSSNSNIQSIWNNGSPVKFSDKGAVLYDDFKSYDDENTYVEFTSKVTGWKFMEIIANDVLYKPVLELRTLCVIVIITYLIFMIVVYFILSSMIFRPIKGLHKGIARVGHGDFTVSLTKKHNDEIGDLVDSYNTMIIKIDELMMNIKQIEEAKTKEKIKVLTMQIGPHFVYNTLNTIKWLAYINKQPNIKLAIESLIKLMMSVTYNTNEEITLREEISLLNSYCYIQKLRYINFEMRSNIGEEILNYKINKLLLQPIVENCILNGFVNSKNKGIITISATIDDILHIEISDNGVGFDTSDLDNTVNKDDESSQHIGIKNVNERIKLSHGERYGVDIHSEVGVGTVVELQLPIIDS